MTPWERSPRRALAAAALWWLASTGASHAADTASGPAPGTGSALGEVTIHVAGWGLLLAIAIAGFFGGLVDGLRSDRQYKARLGGKSWEWGSAGDGLVGTAAALAIFAFAENVFGSGPLKADMPVLSFIKIVAWGVLSGYAGTRLLDPLSAKVVKQIATDTARAEVRDQMSRDDAAAESLREAAQAVTQHLERLGRRTSDADDEAIGKPLETAQRKYELVLKSDPANAPARIGLANVHCYHAEHMQLAGKTEERNKALAAALKVVDDLIKRDSQMAKAYYNRACYKTLRAKFNRLPVDDETVADLQRAVELDEHLKDYAQEDDDLATLRGDKRVEWLTGKTAAGKTAADKTAAAKPVTAP